MHVGPYDKADNSTGRKEKSVEKGVEEEKVMCFCGEDCDFGEMACCELCAGWFHFRCMRFKEDVDMLAKKDFVCCFCLASKTLFLLREVEALKNEMKEFSRERNSAEKGVMPTNENDGKAESIPGNQASAIHEKSYSAVVKDPRKEKRPHKKEDQRLGSPYAGKKQTAVPKKVRKAEAAGKKATGSSPRAQQFVGRRKLWGTKRVDTEEEIKAFLVSRVPEAEAVEIKRVFKSEGGRYGWWFLVMVKIEKRSPFLESVEVRVLGR